MKPFTTIPWITFLELLFLIIIFINGSLLDWSGLFQFVLLQVLAPRNSVFSASQLDFNFTSSHVAIKTSNFLSHGMNQSRLSIEVFKTGSRQDWKTHIYHTNMHCTAQIVSAPHLPSHRWMLWHICFATRSNFGMFVLRLGALNNKRPGPSLALGFLLEAESKLQLFGSTDGWKEQPVCSELMWRYLCFPALCMWASWLEKTLKMARRINIHQMRFFFLLFFFFPKDYCQDMMYEGCCTACKEVPLVLLRAGVAHTWIQGRSHEN